MRRTSRIIATICILVLSASATGRQRHVPAEYPTIEAANAEPNVTQEWLSRYNGPANGFYDVAKAIAVDSSDYLYVTGVSDNNYVTIKYSPDTNHPVWVARYDGPSNAADGAHAIAVDSSDNIYVTGSSYRSGKGYDYATVKYSPDSNGTVWVARYNGPGNYHDTATAIAVDSKDNIYVTGHSVGSDTYYDYATIKYSPDSNQPVWVARYNGNDNRSDHALAIAIDSNDNIYVTGRSEGSGTGLDYVTVKYSPRSNQPVWVARYNSPDSGTDVAEAIVVDSDDNIYVTGWSSTSATSYDYTTIKYSPDTNHPGWVARYNGPDNGVDDALAIAVDSSDNIYVTGASFGSRTNWDYTTVKYSPDSNEVVWVARYDGPSSGPDRATAVVVDAYDNIYVTGKSAGSNTGADYATVKYAPDSNQPVWVARYNGPANGLDLAHAIAADSNENIYVTGRSYGSGTSDDYATIKYSQPYLLPLEAEINIRPKTLNLQGKGKWISCRISLPEDYSVADIDPNSILLEDEIAPDRVVLYGRLAVAKFSRTAVQELLSELQTPGEVELLISGQLTDGTIFEGTDTIRIVGPELKLTLRRRVGR